VATAQTVIQPKPAASPPEKESQVKLIKMFGLAMVAAMLAMALVGSGTASAKTSICKVNEATCAEGNRYANGQKVKGSHGATEQGELKGTFGDPVTCQDAAVEGEITTAQGAQQVKGKITNIEWKNCKRGGETCKITPVQLPWEVHVEQGASQDGNGIMWVGPFENNPVNGQPGARVEECLPINCTFKAKEKQPEDKEQKQTYGEEWVELEVFGSATDPRVVANQAELKNNSSLFCGGNQNFWSETYHVTEPKPAWVTQQ
jgi:hypothetical protein